MAFKELGQFLVGGACIVLLWCSSHSLAATYYVDQNAKTASDKNPGTQEKPFATICASVKVVKPGDTVWVRKGVYREAVSLVRPFQKDDPKKIGPWEFIVGPSGESPSRKITFSAWPGEEVVITGSDPVAGWESYKDKIWVKRQWPHNSQQVFVDGELLQQIGGVMVNYLIMRNRWCGKKGESLKDMEPGSFFYDLDKKDLYVWLKDGDDPNKHNVEVSVRPFLWWVSFRDYISLVGFTMRHTNMSAHVNWVAVRLEGNYNTMENCTVEWCDFSGGGVGGSNSLLINCRFNHNGCVGMGASGYGHRIINCETSYNNYRRWSAGWHSGGVKIIPFCHDIVMSGHVAAYNYDSPGIWFDWGNSSVTIQNSICHHNGGPGIMYEVSERATIKNNICYENKGRGIYISSSAYCAILHNICYKNGTSGIVVIGPKRKDTGFFGRGAEGYWPACDNVVWGNILMDNCDPDLCPPGWYVRPELILPEVLDTNEGNVSDYNIFYRTKGRKGEEICFWKGWDENWGNNLAEWQQKSGQDKHSIVAKPLFVDLAKRDFRPTKNSPALCMVKPSPTVRFDFTGVDRMALLSTRRPFFTAGPFEPKWDVVPANAVETKSDRYRLILLPTEKTSSHVEFDMFIPLLQPKIKEITSNKMGIKISDVPFCMTLQEAVFLNKDKPKIVLPVGKDVKKMHFLLAVLNPGDKGTPVLAGTISREDGMKVPLKWISGVSVSSSLGELSPPMVPDGNRYFHSTAVCEGIGVSDDRRTKSPARLFETIWDNENEWYPVKEVRLELVNKKSQIILFAVTAE